MEVLLFLGLGKLPEVHAFSGWIPKTLGVTLSFHLKASEVP